MQQDSKNNHLFFNKLESKKISDESNQSSDQNNQQLQISNQDIEQDGNENSNYGVNLSQNQVSKKKSSIFKDNETNDVNNEIARQKKEEFFKEVAKIVNEFEWKNGKLLELNDKNEDLKEVYLKKISDQVFEQMKKTVFKPEQLQMEKDVEMEKIQQKFKIQIYSFSNPYQSILHLISKNVKKLLKIYIAQTENNKPPNTKQIIEELKESIFALKISPKIEAQVEESIKKAIFEDFQVFIFALTQIPLVYVLFFEQDILTQLQNTTQIDSKSVDLDNLKQYLYFKFLKKLKEIVPNAEFYIRISPQLMIDYVTFMNSKIVAMYNSIQQKISEDIDQFTEKTKKIAIANKYLLVGLLKELSFKIYNTVILTLEQSYFSLIEPNALQRFAKYIIQNHDAFNLTNTGEIKQLYALENPQEVILLEEIKIQQEQKTKQREIQEELASKLGLIANKNENIVVTQVVNKDNQPGLHVTSDKGEFIVHRNLEGEIVVVNIQFVKQKWFKLEEIVEEEKETEKNGKTTRYDEKLESIAKNKTLQKNIYHRPSPSLTENATYYGTVSDVGSSLGYCLANIKNQNNPQEFLIEFGYISAMNGTVPCMVQKIPIFGPILLLGGMGWTNLKLYNNKCANGKTKLQKASKLVFNTGTTIGGSIQGSFIGQAVIPVPILGGIVGGIIGGILGNKTSTMIIKQLNKKKYQRMVNELEENMEDEGYWEYTGKNLDIFGITNQYFIQEAPKDLKIMYGEKHGEIWMTMLAYCIITLYHSQQEQKDIKKNQKKIKILEEKEKQIILEKSKQNDDLKNEIFKDLKEGQQSITKKKQEEEEQQILMKKQKELEKKQKNKKNGHDIFAQEQDNDDESMYWPKTITLPQKWLLNQQVFVGQYIDQISVALKKIMSQG